MEMKTEKTMGCCCDGYRVLVASDVQGTVVKIMFYHIFFMLLVCHLNYICQ